MFRFSRRNNKDGFCAVIYALFGEKYYWPSSVEKYTIPADEIMRRISEAPQPISRRHFIIPNKQKNYDGISIKMFNSYCNKFIDK